MILYSASSLGLVFDWETEGIWTHVLHRSCSCICELDVRLLNHLNWTSTAQLMVHSQGIATSLVVYPVVASLKGNCLGLRETDFGIVLRADFRTIQTEKSGLSRIGLVE